MDPRIPYSQSSGYMGLLHSQHDSVREENSPYESFHSLSSEVPQFSSQQWEAPAPTPPTDTPVGRGKRHTWTPGDDELLISAWLNTSKDPITANYQKSGTFWKRVGDYLFAALKERDGVDCGEHLHYKQRWHKINDQTNKFCGAYAATERRHSSGQNENDVLKEAHDIYYRDNDSKFTLEHAWCVLRYEQKWANLNPKPCGSSKRKTVETGGSQASTGGSQTVDEHETRPIGVKAAKAKRGKAQGKSVEDYQRIWEVRKEDLAGKELLSKLAILDSLLTKKEPLTEAEEAAKDKLLAECI